jgi:hypothetical protein
MVDMIEWLKVQENRESGQLKIVFGKDKHAAASGMPDFKS